MFRDRTWTPVGCGRAMLSDPSCRSDTDVADLPSVRRRVYLSPTRRSAAPRNRMPAGAARPARRAGVRNGPRPCQERARGPCARHAMMAVCCLAVLPDAWDTTTARVAAPGGSATASEFEAFAPARGRMDVRELTDNDTRDFHQPVLPRMPR